jgi:hypothetical protein
LPGPFPSPEARGGESHEVESEIRKGIEKRTHFVEDGYRHQLLLTISLLENAMFYRKSFSHVVNDIASRLGLKAKKFGETWWIPGRGAGMIVAGPDVWARGVLQEEVALSSEDAATIERNLSDQWVG